MPRTKSTIFCCRCERLLPRDAFDVFSRTDRPGQFRPWRMCRVCRERYGRRERESCVPIPNTDDPTGETMLVPLTKGKFAVIDTADADIVRPYTWCVTGSDPLFYAIASMRGEDGKARMVLMHRLLMGDPPEEVDHRDGNGLNNRRRNIRQATPTQQRHNRRPNRDNASGYKGVRRGNQRNGWTAYIIVGGSYIHLGTFASLDDAAHARDAAERQHYGEFARLNFPDDHDG